MMVDPPVPLHSTPASISADEVGGACALKTILEPGIHIHMAYASDAAGAS